MNKVNIMGVNFDPVSPVEALEKSISFLRNDKTALIVTPNPEIIMEASKNTKLLSVLNHADLVLADGIGVIYASKILKKNLKERVTGIDLMESLLVHLSKTEKSFFLLGAKEGHAKSAADNIEKKYSGIKCVGYHHGYFEDGDSKIIDLINDSRPDVLFVGLGSPRQEIWAYDNLKILNTSICLCIGGAIDVFGGKVKRAPKWISKIGFEWLYRLIKQPSRFKRMLKLPVFLIKVFKTKRG